MTQMHLPHRLLNLIGRSKPWTCSLHGIDCPAGSAGCPECAAEHHATRLGEARAEADYWRRLFTVLVAQAGGACGPNQHGVTRIPVNALMVDDLVLVSWPMVEFTYDFSVYRKGSEPEVPSVEQAACDGVARVFGTTGDEAIRWGKR